MDDDEPMDFDTVGQRLRAAREAKGMSVEDVASATRIPTRHLSSLETSDWDQLPASTYSVGFAKNYATAVGLDKDEIAAALRAEMGQAPTPYAGAPLDSFEPADSNRSIPKGLVFGAIAALIVIALALSWLNRRALSDDDNAPVSTASDAGATTPGPVAPTAAPVAQGPVVLTANEPVWIEVRDGATVLKQGELQSGQSFEVPATATKPVLTTGKPEALRVSVGTADAPAVGPAGKTVSKVSLLAADLMRGPMTPVSTGAAPAAASTTNAE